MRHDDPVYGNEHDRRSDPDVLDRIENEEPVANLATSNKTEAIETSRQLMPFPGKNVLSFYDTEEISALLAETGFTLRDQLITAKEALDLALAGDPDTQTKASAAAAIKVLEYVNKSIIGRAAEQFIVQRAARQSSTTTESGAQASADELLRGVRPQRQLPEAALDGVSHAFERPKQEQNNPFPAPNPEKGSRDHDHEPGTEDHARPDSGPEPDQ